MGDDLQSDPRHLGMVERHPPTTITRHAQQKLANA
jgi:hypothetical protein